MTQEQATILLQQLGGNKFIAMTGSKNFVRDENAKSLTMTLRRNNSGAAWLRISLNPFDTYTMEFIKYVSKPEPAYPTIKKIEGVYADMLQDIFTTVTGLQTHL